MGASQYGTIKTDKVLSNISVGFHPAGAISDIIAPNVKVNKQTGIYKEFNKDNWRIEETLRKSGGESRTVIPFKGSNKTYNCQRHSLKAPINDDDRANADDPIARTYDKMVTRRLKTKLMIGKEIDAASKLFNTANFSGKTETLTGDDQWDSNNGTTSYPIDVVLSKHETVIKNCGMKANTALIGHQVFTILKTHPQLANYVSANVDKKIMASKMAEMFEVDRVLIGSMPYNSAAEGLTESNSFIWGKKFLLAYIAPAPALDEPSLMYSFRWMFKNVGLIDNVKKWRKEELESDFIEVNTTYDHKIVSNDCGYLLNDVIS
jgi:hypothetical protein